MGHVHLTEPEHEALCGTSSFEEFRQFDPNNLVTKRLQFGGKISADPIEENVSANIDCVASKAQSVRFGDADSLRLRIAILNPFLRFGVERSGIVHDFAVGERAEARVEMVEALVDKAQRNHFYVPEISQLPEAVLVRARPMTGPQAGAIRFEERIPFPFERRAARNVANRETGLLKPAAEMRFLPLPLGMIKAAQSHCAVEDQTGVRGEDHIGETWLWFH